MHVLAEDYSYRQASTVPLRVTSHDGSDVPIYAAGPMAHLFHTTHEQNYIFHVMTYAACLETNHAMSHGSSSSSTNANSGQHRATCHGRSHYSVESSFASSDWGINRALRQTNSATNSSSYCQKQFSMAIYITFLIITLNWILITF